MVKTLSMKFNDTCPVCGSGNVDWDSEFYEGNTFNDTFVCRDCGMEWTNRYEFACCDVYEDEETEQEYTYTVTRSKMREYAANYGKHLTDKQCDQIAGYLIEDCFDECHIRHYIEADMIEGLE